MSCTCSARQNVCREPRQFVQSRGPEAVLVLLLRRRGGRLVSFGKVRDHVHPNSVGIEDVAGSDHAVDVDRRYHYVEVAVEGLLMHEVDPSWVADVEIEAGRKGKIVGQYDLYS